jgi:hemoglobin
MNRKENLYIPPGGPPQTGRPSPKIFEKMGGENIFLMIRDFYRELEKSSIRSIFPKDMDKASKKSAAFFVFLLGGPPLYQEKYGSPMMRKRHMPFSIDEAARQVWLDCFKNILLRAPQTYQFPEEHLDAFWHFLEEFSGWMVNKK